MRNIEFLNLQENCWIQEKILLVFFEKGTFPYKGNVFKTKKEESEKNRLGKIKDDYKKYIEYFENKSKGINYDLFKDYFDLVVPSALEKKYSKQKIKRKIMS